MSWWVMLFANGTLLYIGTVLACAGLLIRAGFNGLTLAIVGNVLALLGAAGAGLSAAPLAWLAYAVWAIAWLIAMVATNHPALTRPWRVAGLLLFTAISVIICSAESRRGALPRLTVPDDAQAFCVVGDSLSVGAPQEDQNWPELLGAHLGMPVNKYSTAGARVGTSLENAKRIGPEPALILLEIGGNDLFAKTSPNQFESELRALLETVSAPGHTLLMLELPLPPTYNRYGQIQRALAAEFNVTLIPKQVLGGTFTIPDATVDGLHFSPTGHVALAERIARLFGK